MHRNGLPSGADDVDHQVAQEGMLNIQAYGQQTVHIGERCTGWEVIEHDRALKALAYIVRKEDPTAETWRRGVRPRGAHHGTFQAQRFSQTARERASSPWKGGGGTHQGHQVHQVRARTSVVIHQVELGGVASRLRIGMRHRCRGVRQDGAIPKVPGPSGDAVPRSSIRCSAIECDTLSGADELRVGGTVCCHGSGPVAGFVAGDGGGKNPRSCAIRTEHDRQAAGGIASGRAHHLALACSTGPVHEQGCSCAGTVIYRQEVARSGARRAQVEGPEAEGDRATGLVWTDGVSEVLIVAISARTLSPAVQERTRARVHGSIENG